MTDSTYKRLERHLGTAIDALKLARGIAEDPEGDIAGDELHDGAGEAGLALQEILRLARDVATAIGDDFPVLAEMVQGEVVPGGPPAGRGTHD